MNESPSLPLIERLEEQLAELGLGSADEERARALLRRRDAAAALLAALAMARRGERDAALRLALAYSAGDDATIQGHALAAWLLLELGAPGLAIKPVRRALAVKPISIELSELWVDLCQSLDWNREALDALQVMLPRSPRRLALLVRGANLLVGKGNPAAAVGWFARATALDRGDASLVLQTADALERAGDRRRALAAVQSLLRTKGALAQNHQCEAARLLARLDAFDESERLLRGLLDQEGDDAGIRLSLAEFALWRGDASSAADAATAVLAADPNHPGGLRLQAALAMRAMRADAALPLLDAALLRAPEDAQTLAWRAEARLRLNDFAGGMDDAERALGAADGFFLVGWILYVWSAIESGRIGAMVLRQNYEELARGVGAVFPGGERVLDGGDPAQITALLRDTLDRLAGNRSTVLTTVAPDGSLRRIYIAPGPRFLSRRALNLLETAAPEVAFAALDEAAAAYPASSLPEAHRGELLLWLGRTGPARAAFEEAIAKNPFTRWAYVGHAGVAILEGDAAGALAWCDRGNEQMQSSGPSVFAYRGEALRRLGRRDEAIADLRAAVASHSARVGAWVNLALALGGVADDEVRAIWRRLSRQAPGLLHDAGAECGVEAPALEPPEDAVIATVLERALVMMRGNRSSNLVTYFTRSDRLRTVPRFAPDRSPNEASLRDAARLAIASARR